MSAATSSFAPAAAISTTALPFWRATQDRSTHSPPSGPMESPYAQSLSVLRHAKISKEGMITKSSIMLGLGESDDELKEAMADLRAIDVDILTLGQYLQPTPLHLTVKEYVTSEKFAFWKEYEESIGFRYVANGTTGPILI